MSDSQFGQAVEDIRNSISEIRNDVDRLERMLSRREDHKWYHHLPFFNRV